MKILVTAFEPFGGQKVNPTMEVLKLLKNPIGEKQIIKQELPTAFYQSNQAVWKAMDIHKPDVVLSLGQSGGRNSIGIERVAININDTKMADNIGQSPEDEPIFEDGQTAYFSTLPIKKILSEIKENKIPAEISNSAGTYVCNHVMYSVLYKIHKEGLDTKAGFIHVPFIPEQVIESPTRPSMSLQDMVKAIEVACKAIT